jgi:hypothetical protein
MRNTIAKLEWRKCLGSFKSIYVILQLMNKFVDEICDEDELLRHKELLIKENLKANDLMEKVEVE